MKNIILIAVLFISACSFAQKSSSVNGKLTDLESNNAPLVFAHVIIKETGNKTTTDENGWYKFENLKSGSYTLAYSYTGYETKEIAVEIIYGKSKQIDMVMQASSLSLDDLMLIMASADNKTNTTEITN